jgi:flagellar biosynthetic protein FliQ
MDQAVLFDSLRSAMWVAVQMSTPILGVALAVGLVIGLLQALTSIQEMTLTFVPKMLAILATFWASMDFMTGALLSLFNDTLLPTIARGF